jgi:hypothetical protein
VPREESFVTRAAFWRAWPLWAVTMTITAIAIGYDALHPLPAMLADQSGNSLDMVAGLTFIVAFATVGAVLAWQRPGNPIGWLLSVSGLAYALGGFGQMLIHFPRMRTLGNWLGWSWLVGLGLCVFVVLLPVAIGIAVLRYRLYDIDRIISRTVAYAIVTGLLVGVYAGLVLLATHLLRVHTPVAVAAATLTAAALFNPVRRRVQRRVDRRFNRARYDADQVAAAFAARLKDTVDLGSVRDDLTVIVSRALEPAHVSVWISRPQGGPDQAGV